MCLLYTQVVDSVDILVIMVTVLNLHWIVAMMRLIAQIEVMKGDVIVSATHLNGLMYNPVLF